jgi:DNA-binding NtrC family response regulator
LHRGSSCWPIQREHSASCELTVSAGRPVRRPLSTATPLMEGVCHPRIKQLAPGIAVVVVSGSEEAATIRSCIDAGAMSFIPKSAAPEVLTHALQRVLAGELYLPEQVASLLVDHRLLPR